MLNGTWLRKLTDEEDTYFTDLHKQMWTKAEKRGQTAKDYCMLLRPKRAYNLSNRKKIKKYPGAPDKLPQYWIAFVKEHKCIPKQHKRIPKSRKSKEENSANPICELSHVCGNRECIVSKHIVHEWKSTNVSRKTCHYYIREFEFNNRLVGWLIDCLSG